MVTTLSSWKLHVELEDLLVGVMEGVWLGLNLAIYMYL